MTNISQATFEIIRNTKAQADARDYIDTKISSSFSNTSLGAKMATEYMGLCMDYFEILRLKKSQTTLWKEVLKHMDKTTLSSVSAAMAIELVNGMVNSPKMHDVVINMLSAVGQTLGMRIEDVKEGHTYKTLIANIITHIEGETGHFTVDQVSGRSNHIFISEKMKRDIDAMEEDFVMSTFCYLPTIEKPLPHTDLHTGTGGYHTFDSPLLKYPFTVNGKVHQKIREFNIETKPGFFGGINKMQETPFCTNTMFLEAFMKATADGYEHPDFPITRAKHTDNFEKMVKAGQKNKWLSKMKFAREAAAKAGATDTEISEIKVELSKKELLEVRRNTDVQFRNMINNTMLTINTASEFAQYDEFFFPVFLDDRGRRYTYCDGTFSYIGTKLAKACIQLANKERLSAEGLVQMKYALGNALGADKMFWDVRLEEAEKFMDYIRPFLRAQDYSPFFTIKMDDPFNALAAALEIFKWETDLSWTTGYIFHLDARCSGLSILGTMLRDEEVMRLTSVLPNYNDGSNKLPDCYGKLGEATLNVVKTSDNAFAVSELMAHDIFGRGFFKTAMMTLSYGATLSTRNKTSRKLLSEGGIELSQEAASLYNSSREKALFEQFPSCMNYLRSANKLAERQSKDKGYIAFTAPITGFPCFCQKFKTKPHPIRYTNAQGKESVLTVHKKTGNLDYAKMVSWTAPGYIHSSDAAVLSDTTGGVTFDCASIHDSFGSHPNNSASLKARYAFVMKKLFDSRPMDTFFEEMGYDAEGEEYIPIPYVDTIQDGAEILNAQYVIC